jgi:DNA repair protein RadC
LWGCHVSLGRGIAAYASRQRKGLVTSSWSAALDDLRSGKAFEVRNAIRVLFLDRRNHLIAEEGGTVDAYAGASARRFGNGL